MKKIEAIIRRNILGKLKNELAKINISGITILEAGGFGKQRGHFIKNESEDFDEEVYLVPKYKIEIVCDENIYMEVINIIKKVCYTGKHGDGKIFISTIEEAIRIRTGETGQDAL